MESARHNSSKGDDISARCDELAERFLAEVKRRRAIPEYGVIEYLEAGTDDILLICEDGSLLYTPAELGRQMSLKAFKNGFRTSFEALEKRANARKWELALTS